MYCISALVRLSFAGSLYSVHLLGKLTSKYVHHWICATVQVKAIGFYGGASEGMRTMLDALIPAVTALESGKTSAPFPGSLRFRHSAPDSQPAYRRLYFPARANLLFGCCFSPTQVAA